MSTGKLLELSVQQIISCDTNGTFVFVPDGEKFVSLMLKCMVDAGCSGGDPVSCFVFRIDG